MLGAREQPSFDGGKSRSTGLGLRESAKCFIDIVAGVMGHIHGWLSSQEADSPVPSVIGCSF
jgi:hypothetical protein